MKLLALFARLRTLWALSALEVRSQRIPFGRNDILVLRCPEKLSGAHAEHLRQYVETTCGAHGRVMVMDGSIDLMVIACTTASDRLPQATQ